MYPNRKHIAPGTLPGVIPTLKSTNMSIYLESDMLAFAKYAISTGFKADQQDLQKAFKSWLKIRPMPKNTKHVISISVTELQGTKKNRHLKTNTEVHPEMDATTLFVVVNDLHKNLVEGHKALVESLGYTKETVPDEVRNSFTVGQVLGI